MSKIRTDRLSFSYCHSLLFLSTKRELSFFLISFLPCFPPRTTQHSMNSSCPHLFSTYSSQAIFNEFEQFLGLQWPVPWPWVAFQLWTQFCLSINLEHEFQWSVKTKKKQSQRRERNLYFSLIIDFYGVASCVTHGQGFLYVCGCLFCVVLSMFLFIPHVGLSRISCHIIIPATSYLCSSSTSQPSLHPLFLSLLIVVRQFCFPSVSAFLDYRILSKKVLPRSQ